MVVEHSSSAEVAGEPTLAEFQAAVDAWGPVGLRLRDPIWLTRFRISQRQVSQYRFGRAFLVGDAAHIHSPLGGQGMNTGLQDAVNLAWKLAAVIHRQARADLLDTYQEERHPIGETLLRATGVLDPFNDFAEYTDRQIAGARRATDSGRRLCGRSRARRRFRGGVKLRAQFDRAGRERKAVGAVGALAFARTAGR